MIFTVLVAAAATIPSGHAFVCTPTHVWDGDGPIWCQEDPRIRLAGIAGREMDETCKRGHPCPKATGGAARDRLVRMLGGGRGQTATGHVLVSGPKLQCVSNGSARGARTGAWCTSPAPGNLSCAMLRSGTTVP